MLPPPVTTHRLLAWLQGYDMTNIALPIFQRFMHPTDRLIVNFGLHHWHDYEETLRNFTTYVARHRQAREPWLLGRSRARAGWGGWGRARLLVAQQPA